MPSFDNRAEQQVLSAMMQDAKLCRKLALQLGAADFGDQKHRRYLRALQRLIRSGQEPTIEAIELHVPKGKFTKRDLKYLQELHDEFPLRKVQRNLDALVSQMRWTTAKHRLAAEFLPEMEEVLEDPDTSVADVLSMTNAAQTLARRCVVDGARTSQERFRDTLREREDVSMISSGFDLLNDWYVGGLRPGVVHMIAGRTTTGKTMLVASMIERSAHPDLDRPTRWLTFGLEDGEHVYSDRVMSIRSKIPYSVIVGKWGELSEKEKRDALATVAPYLEARTLQPRGEPEWPQVKNHWEENRARIDTMEAEIADTDADVVVLDLYKMVLAKTGPQDHDYAMRRFAAMAVQYRKHLMLVHQINRNPLKKGRETMRPRLDDLEGGGALEQLSGVVSLLYRPDLYRRTDPRLELELAKQKVGPRGVRFEFSAALAHSQYFDPTLMRGMDKKGKEEDDDNSGEGEGCEF